MSKVLILGAGMVVKPIVSYLLDRNIQVTVASRTKSKAETIMKGHSGGQAVGWTVEDRPGLDSLVSRHDLTVSLLPWAYHPLVAGYCLNHKNHLVTTSYVKPEMLALDHRAKRAGIIILNELGLDPGIDHMSAMRIIDNTHKLGGRIEGMLSFCGALPSPEAAEENPFRYKFSWSPKGVVMAGNNSARYLKDGAILDIPTENLFSDPLEISIPGAGDLEVYPNRDSIPYIGLYGINETKTMIRGTFRHPGWCRVLDAMKQIDLFSCEKSDFTGKSYREFISMMIRSSNPSNIRLEVASALRLDPGSLPVEAMEWLGLFQDEPMNRKTDSAFEIVSDLMIEKMMLGKDERDMVVMQHIFLVSWPNGKKETIKSSMIDFGTPSGDSSVARTVTIPAAIGAEMILRGEIESTGVHIPVIPEIYNPVLDNLEKMNIRLKEVSGLDEQEFWKLLKTQN